MEHPLSYLEPIVLQIDKWKLVGSGTLDDYLKEAGPHTLGQEGFIVAVPPASVLPGTYRIHTRRNNETTLIEYLNQDHEPWPVFTTEDLKLYPQYLKVFHPIQPHGTKAKPSDVKDAFRGMLGEYLLRDRIKMALPRDANRTDEYRGKDLLIKHNDKFVLQRKATGNLLLLQPAQRGKFGYRVVAEMDGLVEWRDHLYILEAKTGNSNVSLDHILDDLVPPLRELYGNKTIHYVLMTHHRPIYAKKHGLVGFELSKEERNRLLAFRKKNLNPVALSFSVTKEQFRKMSEHLIREYHALKHLPYEHEVRALQNKNTITLMNPDGTPGLKLRKIDKGKWEEV